MSKVRPMSAFRIQEFAKLAGVIVRALHHYDRLKLLSPGHRSERGSRIYCHEDLGRLDDEFTFGTPAIAEGYRRIHDDESHWLEDVKTATLRAIRPKPEYRSFFQKAIQACLRHG